MPIGPKNNSMDRPYKRTTYEFQHISNSNGKVKLFE